MKLLLLSLCGQDKQDEDVAYLNLYFASLKRHVIPYADTRVILFSTYNSTHKTQQRVREFELDAQVEVRGYSDMQLPSAAETLLRDTTGGFTKIGVHMNMMFDYAKQHNFFDADWVFHTDTDIEFLNNFTHHLIAFNSMLAVNPRVIISCAGDTYPRNIRHREKEYIFEDPPRWNMYTDAPPESFQTQFQLQPKLQPLPKEHSYKHEHRLVYHSPSLKIRNDFVGLSKKAAHSVVLNWVQSHYNRGFSVRADSQGELSSEQEIEKLWAEHQATSSLPLELVINEDKGNLVLYFLKGHAAECTWIQLRGYTDMAKHYSSGWVIEQGYRERSYAILQKDYMDTHAVWSGDYVDIQAPVA